MNKIKLIRDFLQKTNSGASRSSALKPLGMLICMLLSATLISSYMDTPEWIIKPLFFCTIVIIIVYVSAYIYLLFCDRDALRSEKYSIQKLAIERGLVGDSEIGMIDMDAAKNVKLHARKPKNNGDRS